jgi:HNH endonuclease
MENDPIERFWKRTDRKSHDVCWPWLAGKNSRGYGVMYVESHPILAHRFSLALHRGHAIPKNLFVLHSCDNPCCVNPHHLRMGTQSDNMQEAFAKGRGSPPPRFHGPPKPRPLRRKPNPNRTPGAKITPAVAREIKTCLAAGETGRAIARRYRIHFGTVSDIKLGKIWRDA